MKGLWSQHFPSADKQPAPPQTFSQSKMKGIWSEHFPSAEKPPAPAPVPLPPRQLCFICPSCNAAVCHLRRSSTDLNPGRLFYTCPCSDPKFFKWADEVRDEELIDVPNCGGCSAGVCRVRREKTGPNAGRILFTCRVKEGAGSCGYRVWQDELEQSAKERSDEGATSFQLTTANCDGIGPSNTVVEETRQGDEGASIESPVVDTSQHLNCVGVTSEEVEPLTRREGKRKEFSRRHPKRLLHRGLKVKHCWMTAAIRQNLRTELRGWWGRLAFHPMPCLTTHSSTSFTFNVSSALHSTFVMQNKIPVNSSDSKALPMTVPGPESCTKLLFNPAHSAEPSGIKQFCDSLDVPSSSKPFHETRTHNVMSKSISKVFSQAAEDLQNNLLTFLEMTDVKDHEAMSHEAEATFAALDQLLFNHQDFKKRAEELIHRARSLAEIERSMPTNDSCQTLVEHCSSERTRLDEINRIHAKAVDDMMNNKKHLKDLQEEVRSTMDWIFQIDAELLCCEAEITNIEQELEKISENKEILEGQYLIMSQELESSQKLYELKEAERSAAKAAFDRAKALLRG